MKLLLELKTNCKPDPVAQEIADSDREFGFDIVQYGNYLLFTAEFDYFSHVANLGNCDLGDDRLEFDLVFGFKS